MLIKLFELEGRVVKPSVHCYNITFLKNIMEEFPDQYMKIYSYLFYMSYRGVENPYFNISEVDLEEKVLRDIEADFDIEHETITIALEQCRVMYETPLVRAYNGISGMLDRMARYMQDTEITAGREGNINALISAAKNFDAIRKSFKGTLKDVEEESKITPRGGQGIAYDQRG